MGWGVSRQHHAKNEVLGARRLLIIFNPAAGRSPKRRLDAIVEQLGALGCIVVVRETTARGDAEAFAREADAARFDLVAAAGGDGTINEVVNGLSASELPLAVLPLGTGNVLANELGLPRHPKRLARLIASGTARPVWMGEIANGAIGARRFVMMAGIGFDAAVVAGLDEALKRRVGKLAFVRAILAEIINYRRNRYSVRCDGVEHQVASAVVSKGHFYAGRFVLAPAARLDEPWLHLVLFMRTGRVAALKYLAAMALGIAHRLSDIRILRTTELTVSEPGGAVVEGDGDIVAKLPVQIRVAEKPLLLIQPG
jgi:YegS/Rv2252/BmrU family lipid kinase